MEVYPYGYCGMPCALCTRNHTVGTSRCPGCSAGGYYTDACKVYDCCRERALVHCGECAEFPCARLGRMGDFRDLNTNKVKMRTSTAIKESSFERWYAEYAERAALLIEALARYNDGRMKRYICELFIQRDMETLREIMREAGQIDCAQKERGKAFRELTEIIVKETN